MVSISKTPSFGYSFLFFGGNACDSEQKTNYLKVIKTDCYTTLGAYSFYLFIQIIYILSFKNIPMLLYETCGCCI